MNYAKTSVIHSFTSVNETTMTYCDIILLISPKWNVDNEPICFMLLLHNNTVSLLSRLQEKLAMQIKKQGVTWYTGKGWRGRYEVSNKTQMFSLYHHHMTCINISSSGFHTFVHGTPWFAGKARFSHINKIGL